MKGVYENSLKDERWSDVVGQQRGRVTREELDRGAKNMVVVEWHYIQI